VSLNRVLTFTAAVFISPVLSQPVEPSNDYKYVLRIQREVEAQVAYYLDEPKTGDFKKVHFESTKYLIASEQNSKDENLAKYSQKVKNAVGQLIRKKYDPNIFNPKKSNIRYHYFYIDEFSKE
tara:strand:- start:760 stop:1128 length:369 start_codon:yes stop_codon:yes gene_type:complete